ALPISSAARPARTTWGGRTGADARGDRGRGRRVSGGQPAPGGSAGPGRADVPDGLNVGAGRVRVRRDRAGMRDELPAHHSPVRDPAAHDGHGAAHHRGRGPMTEDGAKAQRDAALRALHGEPEIPPMLQMEDRKSTRLNSSHVKISYAVFCLKKKNKTPKPKAS